jgi:hypothetical protein
MIRTLFYETADGRYVEVNALVGSPIRLVEKSSLPPDVRTNTSNVGAFVAKQMAREHNTYCTGTILASAFMRNLENQFVNPEAL